MAQTSTRIYILAGAAISAAVGYFIYYFVRKKDEPEIIPSVPTESISTDVHLTETRETKASLEELVAVDPNCAESVTAATALTESNSTDSPQRVCKSLEETDETVLSSLNSVCLFNLSDCEALNTCSKSLSNSVCEVEDHLYNSNSLDMATHIARYNDICTLPSFLKSPSSQPFVDPQISTSTSCSTYETALSGVSSGYNVASIENASDSDKSSSSDDPFVLAPTENLVNELCEESSQVVEGVTVDILITSSENGSEENTSVIANETLNDTISVTDPVEDASVETSPATMLDEQDLRVVECCDKSNNDECDSSCGVAQQFESEVEIHQCEENLDVQREEESCEVQQCVRNTEAQSCKTEIVITQTEVENVQTQQCLSDAETQQFEVKVETKQCDEEKATTLEMNTEILQSEELITIEVNVNAETQVECEQQQPPAVPSPSLSVEETELQNLANDNSPSAYGSSSHSPAELESPPNGIPYPEFQSEGSSDSGKGGSDIQAPSMAESYVNNTQFSSLETYAFNIPQQHCGRLIGQRGQNVKAIKSHSGAEIVIDDHPYSYSFKLCYVMGSKNDIQAALKMIRSRFPLSKYPELTLNNVYAITSAISPDSQLRIPNESICHVLLSATVTPGHFFLQQPTHPTYPQLEYMTSCMIATYSQEEAPDAPLQETVVCVLNVDGGWFRVCIGKVNVETSECLVKFLDYGGYMTVPRGSLKQLKYEYSTLPFQAEECFLANVGPIDGESWTPEARQCFQELASGIVLEATIAKYNEYGTPEVLLNRTKGTETIFINNELVRRGHARWLNGD